MTSPRSGRADSRLPPEQGTGWWEDTAQTPRSPLTPEYPPNEGHDKPGASAETVIARMVLPLYLIAITAAVLLPDPRAIGTFKYNVGMHIQQIANQISHVSPTTLGDIASNIVAFIPLTLLLGLAWRRVPVWVWGLVGMLASVAAETAQYLLPELSRRPDAWNVVENSIGAWIGTVAALLIRPSSTPSQNRSSP